MKSFLYTLAMALVLSIGIGASLQAQTQHPLPPSATHSNVMSSFRIKKDGLFQLIGGYGYFFTHDKGIIKFLRDGEEIAEYSFRVRPSTPPFYEYWSVEILKGKNDAVGHVIKKGGSYELAFYMGGKKFHSHIFELEIKGSGDPYSSKKRYIAKGDWNDYAFLYRSKSKRLTFFAFMQSDNGELQPSKGKIVITRDSDGKIVAVDKTPFRREGWWKRFAFIIQKPGEKKDRRGLFDGKEWRMDQDKFEDGGYTLQFDVDEKPYGTYKFTVKDGEIQQRGRQVRESTDPLRFIEGGRNQFWLKKK